MCLTILGCSTDPMPEAAIRYKSVLRQQDKVSPIHFRITSSIGLSPPGVGLPSFRGELGHISESRSPGRGWGWNGETWTVTDHGEPYPAGVHVYTTKADAFANAAGRDWIAVAKVLVRGPLVRGMENDIPVEVWREVTILEIIATEGEA